MKLVQLSVDQSSNTTKASRMEHVPIFNTSDLLWRYPLGFQQPSNPYPQIDFKTHLPNTLASDPRLWSRDDVSAFLRWCEFEFDLPRFDMEFFQMNGKALCLLTKADLNERSPGCGDVLHNILQMLIRERLPSSPLTPHFPLTPSWSTTSLPVFKSDFPGSQNSVTLSPAPSVDSQGSPRQPDQNLPPPTNYSSSSRQNGSSGSTPSDSDGDEPTSPTLQNNVYSPPPQSPLNIKPQIFFPSENMTEPNTNGRLLWDFLQQLLNDSMQRYTSFIAWKNREAGVFKIVDPPGLAKLWGIQKNHLSMNYDKMSRALRYYYRVNILRKVQGERHCYQFLRNPNELKSIKNISLLRNQIGNNQQPQSQQLQQQQPVIQPSQTLPQHPSGQYKFNIKTENNDEEPTDLSTQSNCPLKMNADMHLLRNASEASYSKGNKVVKSVSAKQQLSQFGIKHERREEEPTDLSTHSYCTGKNNPDMQLLQTSRETSCLKSNPLAPNQMESSINQDPTTHHEKHVQSLVPLHTANLPDMKVSDCSEEQPTELICTNNINSKNLPIGECLASEAEDLSFSYSQALKTESP